MDVNEHPELHAWDLAANDLGLLWIAQGSTGAGLTLPSGRVIPDEATWQRLLREAREMNR
jgi:hypothetical protein